MPRKINMVDALSNLLHPYDGTNITAQHEAAFNALRDSRYGNFALFSCFVDGVPTAAIVAIKKVGEIYEIEPLFVAVTANMILTNHDNVRCNSDAEVAAEEAQEVTSQKPN